MTFKFKTFIVDEVPVSRRQGSQLPFPWDSTYADFKKNPNKAPGFEVPVQEFWITERKLDPATITAADLRDRIRRAFYTWRDQQEEQLKGKFLGVSVTMTDILDDERKLIGTAVYLKAEDTEARKEAIERGKARQAKTKAKPKAR